MSDLKTKPSRNSVQVFLKGVENETRRKDARELLTIMKEITSKRPVMWGDKLVGFGSYHYKYASGREGDWLVTGFSPGKQNLTVYIMNGFSDYQDLLGKLGKHKTAKSCLYINKLEEIDKKVLKRLITRSIKDMKKLYDCR